MSHAIKNVTSVADINFILLKPFSSREEHSRDSSGYKVTLAFSVIELVNRFPCVMYT